MYSIMQSYWRNSTFHFQVGLKGLWHILRWQIYLVCEQHTPHHRTCCCSVQSAFWRVTVLMCLKRHATASSRPRHRFFFYQSYCSTWKYNWLQCWYKEIWASQNKGFKSLKFVFSFSRCNFTWVNNSFCLAVSRFTEKENAPAAVTLNAFWGNSQVLTSDRYDKM